MQRLVRRRFRGRREVWNDELGDRPPTCRESAPVADVFGDAFLKTFAKIRWEEPPKELRRHVFDRRATPKCTCSSERQCCNLPIRRNLRNAEFVCRRIVAAGTDLSPASEQGFYVGFEDPTVSYELIEPLFREAFGMTEMKPTVRFHASVV